TVLNVNLLGVVHGSRLFAAQMAERGQGGHIVNTSSAAAFTPSRGLAAYSTSKAAALMLSECLRAELKGKGIAVSAVVRPSGPRGGAREAAGGPAGGRPDAVAEDRKSTRLNSSHVKISYAVFCLKKKTEI